MATLTPRNGDLTAGMAGQSSDTLNPNADPLLTGDVPAWGASDIYPLAADANFEAREVVGFDADGNLTAAITGSVDPDDDIAPIGIIAYAADNTGGADGAVSAEVWRSGVFNPDLLVWPASFSTDALKRRAFEGAPSPTNIYIRKPATMTVA